MCKTDDDPGSSWKAYVALSKAMARPGRGIQRELSRPELRERGGERLRDIFGEAVPVRDRRGRKGWVAPCKIHGPGALHVRIEKPADRRGFILDVTCGSGCTREAILGSVGRTEAALRLPRYAYVDGPVAEAAGLVDEAADTTLAAATRKHDPSTGVPLVAYAMRLKDHAPHSNGELNRRLENAERLHAMRSRPADNAGAADGDADDADPIYNISEPTRGIDAIVAAKIASMELLGEVLAKFPERFRQRALRAVNIDDDNLMGELLRELESGQLDEYIEEAQNLHRKAYEALPE